MPAETSPDEGSPGYPEERGAILRPRHPDGNGTPVPTATGPMAHGRGPRADIGQSSGSLIQPWRMAYTTAWVRSFTLSLRRMEDMWFFTVCSLMPSV